MICNQFHYCKSTSCGERSSVVAILKLKFFFDLENRVVQLIIVIQNLCKQYNYKAYYVRLHQGRSVVQLDMMI